MVLTNVNHFVASLYFEYDFTTGCIVAFDGTYEIHGKDTIANKMEGLAYHLLCYIFFESSDHTYIIKSRNLSCSLFVIKIIRFDKFEHLVFQYS